MAKHKTKEESKNKKKSGGKRLKKREMTQAILSVFQAAPKEPFNYKQISKMIGASKEVQKLQVVDILYDLALADVLSEVDRGRYRLNNLGTMAIGTFSRRSNGKNSFTP